MSGEGLKAGAMSWDRAFRVTGRMLAHGHPSGQPYMPYDDVLTTYKKFGGTTK